MLNNVVIKSKTVTATTNINGVAFTNMNLTDGVIVSIAEKVNGNKCVPSLFGNAWYVLVLTNSGTTVSTVPSTELEFVMSYI